MFTRVIFRVTSSQFLLNETVQIHANKHENIDPEFAKKVKKHFSVDDLNSGPQITKVVYKSQLQGMFEFLRASNRIV